MKVRDFLLIFAFAIFLLTGCSVKGDGKGETVELPSDVSVVEISDLTSDGNAWADSVLKQMTLEERVGQLFLPAVYATSDALSVNNLRRYAADWHIGGVVLLKGKLESVRKIRKILENASSAPPIMAMDAEWGLGMRLTDTPVFPRNGKLPEDVDQNLLYEYGREVARECRLAGINMVLGPVADVGRPDGIMGIRSFGADPVRVAELTVAYARGLEDGNVLSVAKHFPGHGSPHQNSHQNVALITSTREQLEKVDLLPFRAYAAAGLSGIMAGHLTVPAVDSTMCPASFSNPILTDLLRRQMGFRGLVLTDALNMGGAAGYTSVDALRAGADIVLAPENTGKEIMGVIEEINSGRLPVNLINDRCRRILFYKYLVRRSLPAAMPTSEDLDTRLTDSLRRVLSGLKVQRNS